MTFRNFSPDKIPKYALNQSRFMDWYKDITGPLVVEIGCGVGLHPIKWAKENPRGGIIAFERTRVKFQKFQNRLAHHTNLSNIFALHADASLSLPKLITDELVDEIFIYYPNPYPKPKQKNLRFAFSPFTEYLFRILKRNGRLNFATNIESYALELKSILPNRFPLKIDLFDTIDNRISARTHFEKKYLERNMTCFDISFRKIDLETSIRIN